MLPRPPTGSLELLECDAQSLSNHDHNHKMDTLDKYEGLMKSSV